ncbi:hypothetical protein GQ42DRAFT_158910 [Ramicandelaber brevisporus]|nr:hypothetical protein GQ42DRAFT_158910 [Ramicandelaber brevisporus]
MSAIEDLRKQCNETKALLYQAISSQFRDYHSAHKFSRDIRPQVARLIQQLDELTGVRQRKQHQHQQQNQHQQQSTVDAQDDLTRLESLVGVLDLLSKVHFQLQDVERQLQTTGDFILATTSIREMDRMLKQLSEPSNTSQPTSTAEMAVDEFDDDMMDVDEQLLGQKGSADNSESVIDPQILSLLSNEISDRKAHLLAHFNSVSTSLYKVTHYEQRQISCSVQHFVATSLGVAFYDSPTTFSELVTCYALLDILPQKTAELAQMLYQNIVERVIMKPDVWAAGECSVVKGKMATTLTISTARSGPVDKSPSSSSSTAAAAAQTDPHLAALEHVAKISEFIHHSFIRTATTSADGDDFGTSELLNKDDDITVDGIGGGMARDSNTANGDSEDAGQQFASLFAQEFGSHLYDGLSRYILPKLVPEDVSKVSPFASSTTGRAILDLETSLRAYGAVEAVKKDGAFVPGPLGVFVHSIRSHFARKRRDTVLALAAATITSDDTNIAQVSSATERSNLAAAAVASGSNGKDGFGKPGAQSGGGGGGGGGGSKEGVFGGKGSGGGGGGRDDLFGDAGGFGENENPLLLPIMHVTAQAQIVVELGYQTLEERRSYQPQQSSTSAKAEAEAEAEQIERYLLTRDIFSLFRLMLPAARPDAMTGVSFRDSLLTYNDSRYMVYHLTTLAAANNLLPADAASTNGSSNSSTRKATSGVLQKMATFADIITPMRALGDKALLAGMHHARSSLQKQAIDARSAYIHEPLRLKPGASPHSDEDSDYDDVISVKSTVSSGHGIAVMGLASPYLNGPIRRLRELAAVSRKILSRRMHFAALGLLTDVVIETVIDAAREMVEGIELETDKYGESELMFHVAFFVSDCARALTNCFEWETRSGAQRTVEYVSPEMFSKKWAALQSLTKDLDSRCH